MKIVSIVGVHLLLLEAAPVSRRRRAAEHLLHTGHQQDVNMSMVFLREFGLLEPHARLGVGSSPHGAPTDKMLARAERR